MEINWPTTAFQTRPAFAVTLQKNVLNDQEPSFVSIFTGSQQYFLEFVALNATKAQYFIKLAINETVCDLNGRGSLKSC